MTKSKPFLVVSHIQQAHHHIVLSELVRLTSEVFIFEMLFYSEGCADQDHLLAGEMLCSVRRNFKLDEEGFIWTGKFPRILYQSTWELMRFKTVRCTQRRKPRFRCLIRQISKTWRKEGYFYRTTWQARGLTMKNEASPSNQDMR